MFSFKLNNIKKKFFNKSVVRLFSVGATLQYFPEFVHVNLLIFFFYPKDVKFAKGFELRKDAIEDPIENPIEDAIDDSSDLHCTNDKSIDNLNIKEVHSLSSDLNFVECVNASI